MSDLPMQTLLPAILAEPERASSLSVQAWSELLSQARRVRVVARLAATLDKAGALDIAPENFRDNARGALTYAQHLQCRARFEAGRLETSLGATDIPVILLKGAAYIVQNSAAAAGRGLSDVDVMVPRDALSAFEKHLRQHDWVMKDDLSSYDEFYYREYTHELPPYWHEDFQFELDVHHNILQPTHRLAVVADKLWERARPIPDSRFLALAPEDQILHSATHLTMSDELRGGLRDIHDIKLLLDEATAQDQAFPARLIDRATELNLGRPLFYCLDFLQRSMGMEATEEFQESADAWAPPAPIKSVMQVLVDHRCLPQETPSRLDDLGEQALYLRSHWIRMPPGLLARHLFTKARQRRNGSEPGQA